MQTTSQILRRMAEVIDILGVHTGDQFAIRVHQDRLTQHDICALAWVVAEGRIAPKEFFTDEDASIRLIECSAGAMQAIRALSDALDSEPCTTPVTHDHAVPDYIEHVSNWAATAPIGSTEPPTVSEVIGRILRAAAIHADPARFPHQRTAA